ncbi:MAG: tryptophan 2,3-dioxygenase [Microbacteriaceae bacterium]
MTSGERTIEDSVKTDFRTELSYGRYLELDAVLGAQHPLSDPEHPDEMLFIIQHQTSELWLKLILHELVAARAYIDTDDIGQALKALSRVRHVQKVLTEQWSVLATLTPSEYAGFRGVLGSSSGFQSYQYRAIEFILGNKHPGMLKVFESQPEIHAILQSVLDEPTVYDSFLRYLARHGYAVPQSVLDRDVREAWVEVPELVDVFAEVYNNETEHWTVYETCEALVDVEDAFQFWRFRHLRTVQRIIGFKTGTGGSSGIPFLRRALDLTFFPELYSVRTTIADREVGSKEWRD